jgi:hypothetical protein
MRTMMSNERELLCRKCGCNLEGFNMGYAAITHCPRCGRKLLRKQEDKLRDLCTDAEIAGMIREHLLDMLDNYDDRQVVAFLQAAEYYLYNQLEIDNNGGLLNKKRKAELRKMFKETDYDGSF